MPVLISEARDYLRQMGYDVRPVTQAGGQYSVTQPGAAEPDPDAWTADELRTRAQQLMQRPPPSGGDGTDAANEEGRANVTHPIDEAKQRLRGAGYQVLDVQGESVWMVFWPQDNDGRRRTEALNEEQLLLLAARVPMPDEERTPVYELQRVGVIGVLKAAPLKADSDGEPVLRVMLEISGRGAVGSVPIDTLRDLIGKQVLMQLAGVQVRLEI